MSSELHHSKVSPSYRLLDLVEANFERGAAGVAGGLTHDGAVDRGVNTHHHSYYTLNLKWKTFNCLFILSRYAGDNKKQLKEILRVEPFL